MCNRDIINENLWDVMQQQENKEKFSSFLINYVIDNIKDAFGYCCRYKYSLKQYCPAERFGGDINQATVFASVRLSEMWENGCYESLKNLFGMREISIDKIKRWTTAEGDFIIFNEVWELKTSQAKDSWTGATHSSHKTNNFILINYKVDWDIKLDLVCPPTIIPEFSIHLLKIPQNDISIAWKGKPTNNNSFTSLKILNDWIINECVTNIFGELSQTKFKYAKIIHDKSPLLTDEQYSIFKNKQ